MLNERHDRHSHMDLLENSRVTGSASDGIYTLYERAEPRIPSPSKIAKRGLALQPERCFARTRRYFRSQERSDTHDSGQERKGTCVERGEGSSQSLGRSVPRTGRNLEIQKGKTLGTRDHLRSWDLTILTLGVLLGFCCELHQDLVHHFVRKTST